MLIKSPIETKLDEEIIHALKELEQNRDDPEKTAAIVDRIAKLHKLKTEERLKLPSLDTALIVGANIFGILWLTRYEREHPINSKALGFVMKPR
jgi:hypothetical protein